MHLSKRSRHFKVGAFIVNYNMPERADAIFSYLNENCDCCITLIDNGSDIVPIAENTNVRIMENVQTTGGWLRGLAVAKENGYSFDYYMFLITSTEFLPLKSGDVVKSMTQVLDFKQDAVGVHASLTSDSTTHWQHLINRGAGKGRETWFIDNVCSMYKAKWFDEVGGFDPAFTYAHGIDLELSYLARKNGKKLFVDDKIQVKKVTDIAYTLNRMNMTAEERAVLARANMVDVMVAKYGENWENLMFNHGVKDNLR